MANVIPMKETDADRAERERVKSTADRRILQIVEQAEDIMSRMAEVKEELKDHWSETKAEGYNVAALKRVIAERRKSPEERQEEAALFELYAAACGLD